MDEFVFVKWKDVMELFPPKSFLRKLLYEKLREKAVIFDKEKVKMNDF